MPRSSILSREVEFCVKEMSARVDRRHIAFQVKPEIREKGIVVNGFVHFPQQEEALLSRLSSLPRVKKEKIRILSRLKILSKKKLWFAQVKTPLAPLRLEPKRNGEMATQVLFGSFVLCYFSKGSYWYCAAPDGYLGYLHKENFFVKTREDYLGWLNGRRGRVQKEYKKGEIFIPSGSELACADKGRVILPDGSRLRMNPRDLYCYKPGENKKIKSILSVARSFLGVPYIWGGKSRIGIDCSGFTQLIFLLHNIALPRDASQQASIGHLVGMIGDFRDVLPGDLLFFMGRSGRIIHVGISLGGDRFLHASLREGITESRFNELDMGGQSYRKTYIMGRRILVD